uniref:ANF_receptor domain-containing protein n=1 Tax=Angiostrongylus cantonensis TaxID=6313 RepID=A0A0K0CYE6_ANGCA
MGGHFLFKVARHQTLPDANVAVLEFDQKLAETNKNVRITYRRHLTNFEKDTFKSVLRSIREVSRIIVVCMEAFEAQRQIMVSIAEEGMATTEYMWLLIEIRRRGFGEVWKDTNAIPDGKDELVLRAARQFFVIDRRPLNSTAQFVDDVKEKMLQPPYNCTDCDEIDLVSTVS